jgi:hypothetical protein
MQSQTNDTRRTYVYMVRRQHTLPQLKRLLLQNQSILMPSESVVCVSEIMHSHTWERKHVTDGFVSTANVAVAAQQAMGNGVRPISGWFSGNTSWKRSSVLFLSTSASSCRPRALYVEARFCIAVPEVSSQNWVWLSEYNLKTPMTG